MSNPRFSDSLDRLRQAVELRQRGRNSNLCEVRVDDLRNLLSDWYRLDIGARAYAKKAGYVGREEGDE